MINFVILLCKPCRIIVYQTKIYIAFYSAWLFLQNTPGWNAVPAPGPSRVKIILFENGNSKVNALIKAGIKQKKDEFRR